VSASEAKIIRDEQALQRIQKLPEKVTPKKKGGKRGKKR
jgi:hypothetical protein